MMRLRTSRTLGYGGGRAVEALARQDGGLLSGYGYVRYSMAHLSAAAEAQVQEPPTVAPPSSSIPSFSPASPEVETLIAYHERTKHTFENYAETPATPDLTKQPSPFRKYSGGPRPIPLRHLPPMPNNPADQAYTRIFSEFFNSMILTKAAISQLFYDSFANGMWKQAADKSWALRVSPSCGNLHPLEAYIVCSNMLGISDKPFVAHYSVKEHTFEIRATLPFELWTEMKKDLPHDVFFVAVSAIDWRQAWKYGERGFRYVHQDVGHALGAVSIAAAAQGWDSQLVDGWGGKDLDLLLGLPERKEMPASTPKHGHHPELENERAVCLIALHSGRKKVNYDYNSKVTQLVKITNVTFPHQNLLEALRSTMPALKWIGRPNEMSTEHVYYDWIDKAASASLKQTEVTVISTKPLPQYWSFTHHYKQYSLREVIHKRRSATKMDGRHMFEREAFYQMLWKATPSGFNVKEQGETHQFPFRLLPWDAEVHMAFLVHRITNLPKGLYFLVRNLKHEQQLRQALRPEFQWEKPERCPEHLPLYKLADADMEKLAKQTACFQDIAADGCFTAIMLARFNVLNEKGPWMYPRLHWECGMLGQLLSLEAHSMALSSCGIGSFFDDPVNQILGLKGKDFQSLYMCSVGAAVEDKRILCLPPYPSPDLIIKKP